MGRVCTALVLALAAAPPVCANASPNPDPGGSPILGGHGATASVSNATPGARPVALTIRLRAELQCGRFNATSIMVSLPTSMRVPSSITRAALTVGGKTPDSVGTSGTRILIHPAAPKPGVTCDVISPGVVVIKFTRLAELGNPLHPGSYAFGVVAKPRGGEWHGVLAIR
jgi:hypothetical protein